MSLPPVVGHEDLQARLRGAVEAGRLPQSLLFHGPVGIGKQRLALWLAALIHCGGDGASRPCGGCRSCRLADGLQHPDIHWFFPLPAPKGSSSPRKRREKLEEARLEALAARRESLVWPTSGNGAESIFLAAVDEIRSRASRRPAMGDASVFVIGEAERMVPQASSPEAANALLKLLEEPPSDLFLFLTTSRPGALLPTIRSRLLGVRVVPPDVETAAAFLEEHGALDADDACRLARRTEASIGLALRTAEEEDEDPREEAIRLLECALTGGRGDRMRFAARYPSYGGRGAFSAMLSALGGVLRDVTSHSAGASDAALDPGLARRLPAAREVPVESVLRGLRHVEEALDAAAGNGNPQAIAAVLLADLARELAAGAEGR